MIRGFISENNNRIMEWKCDSCSKKIGEYHYDSGRDDIKGWVYCPYCGEKLEVEPPEINYDEMIAGQTKYYKDCYENSQLNFNEEIDTE